MEELLREYEDIMLDELNDIRSVVKSSGSMLTSQHICDGEKILKSIEHIERILMFNQIDDESFYGANGYGSNYKAQPQYNSQAYSRNRYGTRRYGHDSTLRSEIEKKLNMATNENERAVYSNWLMELDNRR